MIHAGSRVLVDSHRDRRGAVPDLHHLDRDSGHEGQRRVRVLGVVQPDRRQAQRLRSLLERPAHAVGHVDLQQNPAEFQFRARDEPAPRLRNVTRNGLNAPLETTGTKKAPCRPELWGERALIVVGCLRNPVIGWFAGVFGPESPGRSVRIPWVDPARGYRNGPASCRG